MVQKTFGIYSEDLSGCRLFIETGKEYVACWCKKNDSIRALAFELFMFEIPDANDFEKLFGDIRLHSRLLNTSFDNVFCIWGHEKCVAIPRKLYNETSSASIIELMFGETTAASFCKDELNDMVLIAELPENPSAQYSKQFQVTLNAHKYYQLLNGQYLSQELNKIHVVFYPSHFIVSVFKQGKLQLIRSFSYRQPEDVLYHLLNTCKIFNLSVNETNIYAGGMIDTSSPLYETLNAYINHLQFEPTDKNQYAAEGFHEFPLHYFSSFCQYDL